MRCNSEAKRSAHEEFSQFDQFLQDCEGLTYILLSWEHGNTVHPTPGPISVSHGRVPLALPVLRFLGGSTGKASGTRSYNCCNLKH